MKSSLDKCVSRREELFQIKHYGGPDPNPTSIGVDLPIDFCGLWCRLYLREYGQLEEFQIMDRVSAAIAAGLC